MKNIRTGILKYLFFFLFLVFTLLPFYWLIITSITPRAYMFQTPPSYFPTNPTLENYYKLFTTTPFLQYLKNSLIIAIISSILTVFFSFLAAYAFARIRFRGSNLIFFGLLLTTALPEMLTIIPLFEIFNKLKLVNTYHGIIILISSLLIPFTIWIMISFIKQIPFELEEAALVDGASRTSVIIRIILPLTLPAVSSMIILNFISSWNELIFPLIFALNKSTKTLSVALGEFIWIPAFQGKPWDLITTLSTIMIIPTVLIVLAFQRNIISGLTKGAIK